MTLSELESELRERGITHFTVGATNPGWQVTARVGRGETYVYFGDTVEAAVLVALAAIPSGLATDEQDDLFA